MSHIGFIGTGHIAAPMARFLCTKGHKVTVSERNAETAAALVASHGVYIAPNQTVVDASDIVFLALRPHVAEPVISDLVFRADQKIVSVMAGISLERLRTLCAPATEISMTIPLGFLEDGGCPLPACPDAGVLDDLFAPENPVLEVKDEAAFNMHFAACAFVPGVLDLMATTAAWLGAETGDRDQAAQYVHQLLAGFLTRLPGEHADVLPDARDALATEGTLSLQMTNALQSAGVHAALRRALCEIGERLGEKG